MTRTLPPTVVVGIDGSDSALDATRWAANEARARRCPLRVVIAVAWPAGGQIGDPGLGRYHSALVDAAREQVARAAEVAREAAPGLEVEQHVAIGFPVPLLLSESRRASLVVVGSRGLGGVAGLLLGSVAVGVAARAECPVAVIRGSVPAGPDRRPVVVGVDGSPLSERAVAFAFEAAATRGVPLVAVHTWWDTLVDPLWEPMIDWAAIEGEENEVLAERLAGWCTKYPDVAVERVVRRDQPAHALLEQAGQAQLVVVGSRGRGDLRGLLLGSVSHALLHRAECPVVIVR